MSGLRFEPVAGMPPLAIHKTTPENNKTGTWRSVRPVYETKRAPCQHECPAGENIPAYFELVKHGRLAEAWELIRQDNPLPAVSGRVCYHPCEDGCNRRHYDEGLNINAIERFVGDYGLRMLPTGMDSLTRAGNVAIVGAGPAGLSCAHHLSRMDYDVTIFEAAATPGGMLALGIPAYRLPRDILLAEIGLIEGNGVRIVTNTPIGPSFPLDALFEMGFQAVFLAIGAHRPLIPAQMELHDGDVIMATDFLRQVNSLGKPAVGERVAVVGGGNVAIDAARSALRLGAREVTILYRRSRADMPAHESEIAAAEGEGVRFRYGVSPIGVVNHHNALTGSAAADAGFRCVRTSLGDQDASGRYTVTDVPGSEFIVPADTLILATGQAPATDYFASAGLALNPNGTFVIDATSMVTSREMVFAGGDAASGPARVVDAIAAGKRAAASIHRAIHPEFADEPENDPEPAAPVVTYESLNLDYYHPAERVRQSETPAGRTFFETSQTLAPEQVVKEIERCFSCGLCNGCDNCWLFCPDVAISRETDRKTCQKHTYRIDYDFCKGCGICVTECPRSAIRVEEEAK